MGSTVPLLVMEQLQDQEDRAQPATRSPGAALQDERLQDERV